ncbi:OmpW/AlkL family protein [Altererythrobacter sp. MF3-039]|uniref:OmpW/AlkL family protein n=1 Tax=Altererythrobacter sp. MF3-039 TaxID=3252901 RepID=UPI00390CBCD0
MNRVCLPLFALVAAGVSAPAMAQGDRAGSIQAKVFATAVLPDGEITEVEIDEFGLPAGTQSEANNNITPTVAVEYFISNNFSIETIAGVTQHDVDGLGGLDGAELVSDAKIIPGTVTLKYHFDVGSGFKPYIGAGPAYFIVFGDDAGADVAALGVTDVDLTNEFGFALQAGADIALSEGFGLSIDAKRYFIGTDARFFVDDTEIIRTKHDLDPWVLSAGAYFRF